MESSPIQICHFSHRHPLAPLVEEKDGLFCSGCELQLIFGPGAAAFRCSKPTCDFTIHDSCLDLPRDLKHDSHPQHRLVLRFHPPYPGGAFTCSACADVGHGFTYHCAACKFDLHVECASLPEVEQREDHDHPFVLLYSSSPAPVKGDAKGKGKAVDLVYCFVCRGPVENDGSWLYRCSGCSYGAHLDCISH